MWKRTFFFAFFLHCLIQIVGNVVHMHVAEDNFLASLSQSLDVQINLDAAVGYTGPKFVGVAIDASFFRKKWRYFDVHSKKVHSLVRGLTPSLLRIGGTAADFLIFNATAPAAAPCDLDLCDEVQDTNFTLSGLDWDRLNYLVKVANWDLIFDVNVFLRRSQAWDPHNAWEILKYSQDRNYPIPCFQLGNEPNAYQHNFNISIPPARMMEDMQILRSLLSAFPLYHNSCIVGPEVTKVTEPSGRTYLEGFFNAGGQSVVAAGTLHHYYFNVKDHKVSVNSFVNTTILDSLDEELQIGTSIIRSHSPSLPVWFSETSSVSGGGLPGASDGFAAGFMWLDKLGLSALSGLQTVVRQTFYHGSYALVADDFTPNPDYFLTVLYKRLVQGPVLRVLTSTETVRIYAHCSNQLSYTAGAVTLYILNVQNKPVILNLSQFSGQPLHLYMLTPGDGNGLKSRFVSLNGKRLVLVNKELPPLPPLLHSGTITMASYSFGFVVIPNANAKVCRD